MEKRRININRTPVPSDEIASRKNFSFVLKEFMAAKPVIKPIFKQTWFIVSTSMVAVVFVAITIFNGILQNTRKNESDTFIQRNTVMGDEAKKGKSLPFIHPPFKNLNVGYSDYTVNATKGGRLKHKSGTCINIPANAFADRQGNSVAGDVRIRYRELMNTTDILLAGIPMTYDSAGTRYNFESAGMMEILAFKDDKSLCMAKEKKIDIEMVSPYPGTEYNLYYLDTLEKNWTLKGKDNVLTQNVNNNINGKENSKKSDVLNTENKDGVTIEPMIVRENIVLTDNPIHKKNVQKLESELSSIQNKIIQIEKTIPVQPRKANTDKYNFNIDVLPAEFPELAIYQNVKFEVADEKKFNSKYYNVTWDDLEMKESKIKGNYLLTLFKNKSALSLEVYPVFEGLSFDKAMTVYENKFTEYKQKREQKKQEELATQKERDLQVKQMEQERLAQQMKWEEQQLAMVERQMNQNGSISTQSKVIRAFTINGFGYWNCDKAVDFPKGNTISATFRDDQGHELDFNKVFLVEKGRNAIFTYFNYEFNRIKYNPSKDNMLWAITDDNQLAIYPYESFSKIPDKKSIFTFNLQIISNEPASMEELDEMIKSDFKSTDVSGAKEELNLSVYPNPFTDRITVKVNRAESYTVQLLNIKGVVVKTESMTDMEHPLDVSGLASGSYILRLISENDVAKSIRVIKK